MKVVTCKNGGDDCSGDDKLSSAICSGWMYANITGIDHARNWVSQHFDTKKSIRTFSVARGIVPPPSKRAKKMKKLLLLIS